VGMRFFNVWSEEGSREDMLYRMLKDNTAEYLTRHKRDWIHVHDVVRAICYLIPVLMFFGGGIVSAVLATVIYSIPPIVRLTCLGLTQVSGTYSEVSRSFGGTLIQTLRKIKFPLAVPSLVIGFNQTVIMAFEATYLGSNGWLIKFQKNNLIIDPWLKGDLIFPPGEWFFKGSLEKEISIDKEIDIILLTQGLPDHCHIPTLEMFRKDIPIICPKSAVETLKKIGFSSIKMLKPTEKTKLFNLSFEATAGAPVPQIENGYIVKDDQDNGFYIEPHGYLDENLNKQNLDAVITPTKNLELPLVGSFVKGADVIPKLINKFKPKYILSSTIGGDAKYSGFLNNFISVQDYEEELDCNLVDLKSMQSIMI